VRYPGKIANFFLHNVFELAATTAVFHISASDGWKI
jgi:hypothetical protein